MRATLYVLAAFFAVSYVVACVDLAVKLGNIMHERALLADDSHNAAGGYRDACGELPGLVDDDC
jgi:hypothetical protein